MKILPKEYRKFGKCMSRDEKERWLWSYKSLEIALFRGDTLNAIFTCGYICALELSHVLNIDMMDENEALDYVCEYLRQFIQK